MDKESLEKIVDGIATIISESYVTQNKTLSELGDIKQKLKDINLLHSIMFGICLGMVIALFIFK